VKRYASLQSSDALWVSRRGNTVGTEAVHHCTAQLKLEAYAGPSRMYAVNLTATSRDSQPSNPSTIDVS